MTGILYRPSGFFFSYFINEAHFWHYKKYGSVGRFTVFGTYIIKSKHNFESGHFQTFCYLI
jgi:competence CoiA-like predicted nuclease